MKKINFISLNSSFLKWLYDKIKYSNIEEDTSEFLEGIDELLTSKTRSLMLELEDGNTNKKEIEEIVCDSLVINYKQRIVTQNNIEVQLTPKEFNILYFLAKNRGEIFTKEQIYQAVWDEEYYLDDSNIMAFIRKIRKKIEKNPDSPEYIITIWGIGYKFKR
ncbi:MAG: response regulator transcription factor [Fusobacterium perfoetens]|uniref:winged helix-turn-helix domain-containing protein n=1 Tax=Fusobacterium perfoetens TaxID=852 RepID=UPI0023F2EBA2|nr:response regulator transcription factor [Fusobacterium perfoetens]MCI6152483.1 response regulator transcription factor [Fusobacterium perfoetens]MDY3238200.1 response regulator transcription factor [Fusobacterium perfoetens]